MKNIIVVTGGAGFIGSNLIELLIKKTNFKILSLDNYSSGSTMNHLKSKKVSYINGDTKNINRLLNKYKTKIQVIFHFGEFARIHQSFNSINKCIDANISGTSKVFEFCLENKIKIIYSATSASLGNSGKDQNLSPYSWTKSKNLKMMIQLNKWFGLKYEALYFYNVYGPRQISKGYMATVIGIFEEQYKNNKKLTVVKPGHQKRKFTHINDTVNGCYYAWKKSNNFHYAISNNKSYSILEVAKLFSNKIRLLPRRKGERNKSVTVKSISGLKVHKLECKESLVNYINNIKDIN